MGGQHSELSTNQKSRICLACRNCLFYLVRLMSERIQSMSLNLLVYVDGRALADVFPLKKLWQRQLGRNPLRKDDFDKLI